jgi:hypothetical protein
MHQIPHEEAKPVKISTEMGILKGKIAVVAAGTVGRA